MLFWPKQNMNYIECMQSNQIRLDICTGERTFREESHLCSYIITLKVTTFPLYVRDVLLMLRAIVLV